MFDTNVVSALVHLRRGFENIAQRIDDLGLDQRVVSAITLSELHTMIAKADEPQAKTVRVWRVLLNFRIEDFDEHAALHVGQIRAGLEPRGMKIGPLDTLIAAHARSLNAVLVTDNVREFSRVPGLTVENWQRRPAN
jgi:tRNA(fMet)-specific endonuclease VapC